MGKTYPLPAFKVARLAAGGMLRALLCGHPHVTIHPGLNHMRLSRTRTGTSQ